jgi:hypothetical protein
VDGKVINIRSFFDAAPEISKNVPMLIGSVTEEGNRMSSKPTEEEWHATLAKAYSDEKATAIIAALKKAYPQKRIQTLSYMCSGNFLNGLGMRNNVVKMDRLKHELKAAPAYTYYFTWQSPILDGLPGAWHTAELQFCFDNTKRCEQGTGNTPEAQALAKKMASSWAAFAATGKPSIPGLNWESWVEQQIREGQERGEFDSLPGHGKPLKGVDGTRDEMWWVREKLRREKVSYTPPAMSLRVELDQTLDKIAAATTEEQVRGLVDTINERIRYVNSHTVSGPPTTIGVLDVDDVLRKWQDARS